METINFKTVGSAFPGSIEVFSKKTNFRVGRIDRDSKVIRFTNLNSLDAYELKQIIEILNTI